MVRSVWSTKFVTGPPIVKIGKFQIVRELGTGAHSKIVAIRRSADSKTYALKRVSINGADEHKFYAQACHEFRVAGMLEHPNLLKIHALEIQRDWFFRAQQVQLLLEYVNGKTVDQITGLSMPRLVQVFAQTASALMHMHRRGVCHADIKPNNIMLSREGEVKVIDYGLAWIKGEAKERVQGTPEYMAPEQSRALTVNERTDIYNFGATMYRLVTWRLPPTTLVQLGSKDMTAKLFNSQLRQVHECNPQAPSGLCELIHRCLSFEPHGRPERASEILEILLDLTRKLVRGPADLLEAIDWSAMDGK